MEPSTLTHTAPHHKGSPIHRYALLFLAQLILLLSFTGIASAQPAASEYICQYGDFDSEVRAGYSRLNPPLIFTEFKVEGSTVYARTTYEHRQWRQFGYLSNGNRIEGIDTGSHGTFKNLRNETFDLIYYAKYSVDLLTGKADVEAQIRGAPGGTWRGALTGNCLTADQRAAIEARRTAARTPESAQGFLLRIVRDGTAHFNIANVRDQFGLRPIVKGTETSYQKKMLRGWVEYNRYARDYVLRLKASDFGTTNSRGAPDVCTTSVGTIAVEAAISLMGSNTFEFPGDGLEKEFAGSEAKWSYRLHEDPRALFSRPYFINWRQSTFNRVITSPGRTRFEISTGNRVPYALFDVSDTIADDVESAIRSLQSACRGRS